MCWESSALTKPSRSLFGNVLVALVRPNGGGGWVTRYAHHDMVDSVRVLTDEAAVVIERPRMTRRITISLVLLFLVACKNQVLNEPKNILAYRVSHNGERWNWIFDYCGRRRRPEFNVADIRVRYSEIVSAPICLTKSEHLYSNTWPHGEGLLARDGSPCRLGAGRYYISARPDFGGAEF